ncbi:GAF domain-containing protein [Umezawaea sp. Da 62-37]|uniref:GAF domain-containing sensor histidine kinase n=1 Tax=Umezawaea sp. Da 62-37 TaxID=3075927 RepID=UPI0028F74112|nr:GAF domain-containing protein [Umezawaea sp. Da 62-37]WNV90108.1 GAF domain-containing protein [Umezawaea sp. Da 62-37]
MVSSGGSNAHALQLDSLLRQLTERTAQSLVPQDQLHQLLTTLLSLPSDLSLPDVLRRVIESSCALVNANHGTLTVTSPNHRLLEHTHDTQDPQDTSLHIPIHAHGSLFATLHLTGESDFTPTDTDLVTVVAAAAGIAIENAGLYEQTRRREVWHRASNEVTSALLTGISGREALNQVAEQARGAADGIVAALVLPDNQGELVLEVVDGALGRHAHGYTVPTTAIVWEVFSTGEAKVVDNVEQDGPWPPDVDPRLVEDFARVGPLVLVPMAAGDRVLGVLMVARPCGHHPFDAADVELVESFASQAALVLEFTRVQEDSRRLAILEDRDRIARDLHDLVIQRLFGLGLGLQGLNGTVDQPAVAARLGGFIEEVDHTIREIRRTIFSLHEPPSGGISLRGQLLRAVRESARLLGFEPKVALDGPLDSVVPDQVRPDLLATLREALANAARHAGATSVSVSVAVDRAATRVELVVRDNGKGLPDQQVRHSGGLVNISARADRWSGRCEIESEPGRGVSVVWSVPLVQQYDFGQEAP